MSQPRSQHSWVSGGEAPAFLVCRFCGLGHTMREDLGKPTSEPRFWLREPEGEWRPRVPPTPSCPWRKWVKDVVGSCFTGPSGRVWKCYGFDPRYGYRMRACDDPETLMNVSPREIHKWTRTWDRGETL